MGQCSIKSSLKKKIVRSIIAVQKELAEENLNILRSKMTFHGKPVQVSEGYRIVGPQYMEFGDDCFVGKDSWIECVDRWGEESYSPCLRIGNRFSMQQACHIGCMCQIVIGDNVLIGSKVYITDHYHGAISRESLALPPVERPLWGKPVKIGDNVWIGDNVSIMPGVTIGNNVIVGANSVVTHSFPENVVIAGCPAKVIRSI